METTAILDRTKNKKDGFYQCRSPLLSKIVTGDKSVEMICFLFIYKNISEREEKITKQIIFKYLVYCIDTIDHPKRMQTTRKLKKQIKLFLFNSQYQI